MKLFNEQAQQWICATVAQARMKKIDHSILKGEMVEKMRVVEECLDCTIKNQGHVPWMDDVGEITAEALAADIMKIFERPINRPLSHSEAIKIWAAWAAVSSAEVAMIPREYITGGWRGHHLGQVVSLLSC